jgi:opacity protein-like surface antigen
VTLDAEEQVMTVKRRVLGVVGAVALAASALAVTTVPAQAASSKGCEGGGFRLVNLSTGVTVAAAGADRIRTTIAANQLGGTFGVRGRYAQFDVRSVDFAVLNQAFTGAPNELDMTGGRFTPVFASKVPDHRGLVLNSGVAVELDGEGLSLQRTGTGLSMTLSAKDCAQGGIFQMEPQRGDGTRTRVTHTLATSGTAGLTPFYFDNPNFRARVGQFLGSGCTSVQTGPPGQFCVQVSTRVNIANDLSPRFVARDSAQVADRVPNPACNTATPVTPSVRHCGGVSVWDVASGGRMGFVTGGDATEVANPPTDCVSNCQAQNQVRGRLANLGFPFPVPGGSRLVPRSAP